MEYPPLHFATIDLLPCSSSFPTILRCISLDGTRRASVYLSFGYCNWRLPPMPSPPFAMELYGVACGIMSVISQQKGGSSSKRPSPIAAIGVKKGENVASVSRRRFLKFSSHRVAVLRLCWSGGRLCIESASYSLNTYYVRVTARSKVCGTNCGYVRLRCRVSYQ